jgi:hypothetical protein
VTEVTPGWLVAKAIAISIRVMPDFLGELGEVLDDVVELAMVARTAHANRALGRALEVGLPAASFGHRGPHAARGEDPAATRPALRRSLPEYSAGQGRSWKPPEGRGDVRQLELGQRDLGLALMADEQPKPVGDLRE